MIVSGALNDIVTSPEFFHEVIIETNKKIDLTYKLIVNEIDALKSSDGTYSNESKRKEDDKFI